MTFAEFFYAVWHHDPFPWQEDYATEVLKGNWRPIGMPTAAGKTALIDIAVYALAKRAPRAARRIFFVVDRRVIVDEAAERAVKLAERLGKASAASELGKLAQSLKDLGGSRPLGTAVLRGGIPRDNAWADSPLQPVVICSTVDQVGSSLLFRAYGTSEYGRSIRAGLAAYDSLIILDEAHTSRAFAETLGAIERYRGWADEPLALPFTVVEMSATPRGDSFRETARDLENKVLKRRWGASKRTKLVPVEPRKDEEAKKGGFTGLVEGLAREAQALRNERGAKVIGVIANRVRTARRVHELLVKDEGCYAILLTGRSRPYDRDRIWERWKPVIGLGGKRDSEKPVFVVATQCIEVGANLDFDGLVTEIASMDALEQRFGRLDRDGLHAPTHAAIVAQKDQVAKVAKKDEDVLYGAAMAATWAWLNANLTKQTREEILPADGKKKPKTRKVKEAFVEMGVLALRAALAKAEDRTALVMPARRAPVLMPAHVDLLSQTWPEPAVSPDSSVYLHGPEAGPPDVQVVWRADLGKDPEGWLDMVAMCPPSAAESLAVPIGAVQRWLVQEDGGGEIADIEGKSIESGKVKGTARPVLEWRGVGESAIPRSVRPGMTVVVPTWYGGCDEWGWNPESVEDVDDVGDAVKLRMGRPMLRLHDKLAECWGYSELAKRLREAETAEVAGILETAEASEPWVNDTLRKLRARRPKVIGHPEQDAWAALVGRAVFDQNGVGSSYGREIGLEDHLKGCAAKARTFAINLPPKLRRTVERAAALHDIGKADPRFQAWLRGGNPVKPDELIAKSKGSGQNWEAMERARKMAGYPKGARHELMSVALLAPHVEDAGDVDPELLLHLVASHHGRCRPFAPVVKDAEPLEVQHGHWRARSDHGLERVGSGVSERFWTLTRRYGWYGLAYLESLMRLGDQRQSEAEQKGGKAANA
jgi:CRISPR-associated endonuclease/helicase Cas3